MIDRIICTAQEWEAEMNIRFQSHILQSTQWALFKSHTGWLAQHLLWRDDQHRLLGGANVLIKTSYIPILRYAIKIMYLPRGPVLDWGASDSVNAILQDLTEFAKEQGAVFVKIDPEVFSEISGNQVFTQPLAGNVVEGQLAKSGWQYAQDQIQFKNTFWLSLADGEEALLTGMKQKTRYNIRLAEKKGVLVRQASPADFHLLYQMYTETAQRDGFIIRSETYYTDLWKQLFEKKMAFGLIAEYEGEPLAGMVNFVYQNRAWYFYGMSTTKERNRMPTYLLQWEAMKAAKQLGCTLYDLWGAPDEINEEDSMYGVYRFKLGLGASFVRGIGAWDYPVKPFLYKMISIILPKILDIMRGIRRAGIKREVAAE